MSQPDIELSSDLEWMLESGQATGEMLIEALTSEFFVPVYRLALATFGNPDLAYQVTYQTFGQAWLKVYRFRQPGSVQNWLFGVALDTFRSVRKRVASEQTWPDLAQDLFRGLPVPQSEFDEMIWQAVDGLPERTRLPVLLRFLLGWQEPEIARLLRVPLNSVHWQFVLARKRFLAAAWEARHRQVVNEHELDGLVAASLKSRWPEPEFTPQQFEDAVAQAWQIAVQGKSRQKRAFSIKEGFWMASAILIVAAILWVVWCCTGFSRLWR